MTISENLLSKSIESITLAIELYNKPLIKYRTESVVILIVNSWENALKALIINKKWAKIYNRKKDESKPFDECLECVKSNLGNRYSDDWYQSTKLLYKERCKIVHYHKGLDLVDYMLIQSNIILFKDFIQKYFSKSLIKDKSWYILPVATEIPYTDFDFIENTSSLKNASSEVKSYMKKVIEVHSKQVQLKENKGVLVNVKVLLENVKRIKDSDMVVGINNQSNDKISLSQGVNLSDEGRSVRIPEITEALAKYKYHHKDVLKVVRDIQGYNRKNFNNFMKAIKVNKEVSFDWSTFSNIFPMKISDKHTYAESIIEAYKKYLKK
ncbi:MAG: hypothetical protein HZA80_03230 [Candidatus Taylorbacteria bacterium]|nr:hypothetical protein [Candidatus Taylorbacteria bacterium]